MKFPNISGKKHKESLDHSSLTVDEEDIEVIQYGDEISIKIRIKGYAVSNGIYEKEIHGKIIAVDERRRLAKIDLGDNWEIFDYENYVWGAAGINPAYLSFKIKNCDYNPDTIFTLLEMFQIALSYVADKQLEFELFKTQVDDVEHYYHTNEIDGYSIEFINEDPKNNSKNLYTRLLIPKDKIFYIKISLDDCVGQLTTYAIKKSTLDKMFGKIKEFIKYHENLEYERIVFW